MTGEATALPREGSLGDTPPAGRLTSARSALASVPRARWLGGAALCVLVALSFLLIVIAADRPSGLSPTSHTNYFPRWMAGPLGGLWPSMPSSGYTVRYMFTGGLVLMFASYLVLLRTVAALPARWVIAALVAVHALFVLAPPMALTDVFNYINYGRMEIVHHLNPYTTIPIVEPHSDPSFVLSNWHELLSPYGPLFTLLTFAVVPLGVVGSFWALKIVLALASLATIYLVWRCARLLGRDPVAAIAFVGLNPIVLVWGLGGDHNDFLMVLCIVLGFYLLLLARERTRAEERAHPQRLREWLLPLHTAEVGAGAAFVTAAAFKASAAILIPIVLASVLRSRRTLCQVVIGALAAGTVLGLASLFAFGLHIPDLSTQSRLVTNESVPNLVGLALGAGGETATLHLLLGVVLLAIVGVCCWQAYVRHEAITACGWASIALLLTLSWVLPWYVLWALPLAALSTSRRLRTATIVVGVYLIVAWAPASGILWTAIGFHPERTPLGRLHNRYVRELLQ